MGLCGIKGVPHSKKVTDDCDLIIALGARFAPTFCLEIQVLLQKILSVFQ